MTGRQKMRIIAIPLTRLKVNITGARPNRLTYYQFQIADKRNLQRSRSAPGKGNGNGNLDDGTPQQKKGWLPEEGVANWVTNKAADIWAGFGRAKGGWKLKTFQFGEKLVDRMEFEELALKSIDPSMGPSIAQLKRSPVLKDEKTHTTISLIYPPSELSPSVVLSELRAYTDHRIPRHRKGFFLWMAIAPLTTPFIIIPIIPNLPFFFCVWRSWSHYKAYKSSQYLQSLLEHDLIVPEESEALAQVYKTYQPSESSSRSTGTPEPDSEPSKEEKQSSASRSSETDPPPGSTSAELQHTLLLNREAVPAILSLFELKPDSSAAADLYRAVEQARLRVSTGRTQL